MNSSSFIVIPNVENCEEGDSQHQDSSHESEETGSTSVVIEMISHFHKPIAICKISD